MATGLKHICPKAINDKICGKYLCLAACNRKLCGLIKNVVSTPLPLGTFCPTVPLAGEEAARMVSAQEQVVALPLPSRVQVLFTTLFYPLFVDDTHIPSFLINVPLSSDADPLCSSHIKTLNSTFRRRLRCSRSVAVFHIMQRYFI